jgi:Flp pilus assembly protein TadG
MARAHRDERGQMAILFVLTLLVVFIFFALAFDAGLWYFDHRTAQNQADAAALAAVQELPDTAVANATNVAKQWLTKNGASGDLATCAEPPDGCPHLRDGDIVYSDCDRDNSWDTIRVCVGRDSPGIFAALSNIKSVHVSAVARATVIEEPSLYSLMAMNDDDECKSTFLVHGNAAVSVTGGGGTYTRCESLPPKCGLLVSGTAAELITGVNDVFGCGTTNGGATLEPPSTQQVALDDPFADLVQPTVSGSCFAGPYKYQSGSATLSPGRYCDQLQVSSTALVTLKPGIYVLEKGLSVTGSGTFTSDLNGNGVLDPGEEVLLYDTCSTTPCNGATPDDVEITGSVNVALKGVPAYHNIVIWIDRTAGAGSLLKLGGSAAAGVDGTVYALKSEVDIDGSGVATLTLNMAIVADTINVGAGTITIPYDPLLAPPIRRMALIE